MVTTEQKLKAIIAAGAKNNPDLEITAPWTLNNGYMDYGDHKIRYTGVIEVLLDTARCKAAYGEVWMCEDCGNGDWGVCPDYECPFHVNGANEVPHMILRAWNSGEGNDYKAAIDTAFDLLPKKT